MTDTADEPTMTAERRPRLLDAHAIDAWHRDGYLHLPDLLSDTVRARLGDWVDDITNSADPALLQHLEATSDGPVVARTEHFATLHRGLGALVTEGVVLDSGADLLGAPIVLYKEKVNHKLPGGAGFAPHQDATAYPYIDRHLTCMIAVDDATTENGCLEFVAGRHHELLADDGDGCLTAEVEDGLDWQPLPMLAGEVAWFHSRTPHRSADNHSDRPRRAIFLTFNALADGDRRADYYAEKIARLAAHGNSERARVSTIGHFRGRAVDTSEPTI